jgi:hypothetical protein
VLIYLRNNFKKIEQMASLKFKKISAYLLHVEEYFQFIKEFISEGIKAGIPALLPELFAELEKLHLMADEVLETVRKNVLTGKIEKVDGERETVFSGFRAIVKGLQSHYDPKMSEAAMNLIPVFNTYGKLTKKNYAEETALLYNFIQEMEGKYAQYVATLGLAGWVTKLKELNETCGELLMDRTVQASEKPKYTMKEIREKMDACYGDIVRCLEVKTITDSDHKLEQFFNTINSNVDRYRNAVAQRTGRETEKKAKNEKDEKDETVDEQ